MHTCVMVIDDDEDSLLICNLRLKKSGFTQEVITCLTVQEALNYFESVSKNPDSGKCVPEIIFLDLNMPEVNGWDFLDSFGTHYHKQFPNTSIFILSSSIDPDDAERASFEPLVMGFISKPLKETHLKKLDQSRILKSEFQITSDPKK